MEIYDGNIRIIKLINIIHNILVFKLETQTAFGWKWDGGLGALENALNLTSI